MARPAWAMSDSSKAGAQVLVHVAQIVVKAPQLLNGETGTNLYAGRGRRGSRRVRTPLKQRQPAQRKSST